jgi:methylated-DNA-[protein]-cysteine S-methyltransferase
MKMIYYNTYMSPLGPMLMTSNGSALTGLIFQDQDRMPEGLSPELAVFDQTRLWLDQYFAGREPGCLPPLAPEGTAFRLRVWSLLQEIPYGQTVTYGQLAGQLSPTDDHSRMSAQAVGGAVGANPLAVVIPCHRVMGASGRLTGYGGGVHRKVWLLQHEGIDTSRFVIPRQTTGPTAW